jgi:hypothetical protein
MTVTIGSMRASPSVPTSANRLSRRYQPYGLAGSAWPGGYPPGW